MDERGRLLGILTQARLWHAIAAAAQLGVPDALGDGPRTSAELAAAVGADEPTMYRLLRALAAGGILHEADGRTFDLTQLGELLRSDAEGSLRDWAIYMDRPHVEEAWTHLAHSVRTGENAFAALHGEDVWHWRGHEPEDRAMFDRAMASLSAGLGPALVAEYDFSSVDVVVDVGGGSGTLLASILRELPYLRAVLFDQPAVVESDEAERLLANAGVRDRCERVGGNFFESVPAAADVYILKWILHDWSDADSVRILRSVRLAAGPTSQLLLLESVLGAPNEDLGGKISDLNMLVMPGGLERTEAEWGGLLDAAGFTLEEVRPLSGRWSLLIAAPTA